MFEVQTLINDIISPTLKELGMNNGTNLLLGTAAQESKLGSYLTQIGGGPALGIWQVEPNTNNLVLGWLMSNKPDLYDTVKAIRGRTSLQRTGVSDDINKIALQYNHCYCCAIARCLYFSIAVPLPAEDDIEGMANYWKNYYNRTGAGSVENFIDNYNALVTPWL